MVLSGWLTLLSALDDADTDWIRWLPLALLPVFLLLMYWPVTNTFFDLKPLDWRRWAVVVAWAWFGRYVTLGVNFCLTPLFDRLAQAPGKTHFTNE